MEFRRVLFRSLEGAIGLLAAVARRLEEAGAQRRQNEVEIAPDDAVFVEVGHLVELRLNGGDDLGAACFRLLLVPRVEASEKEKIGRASCRERVCQYV